MTGRDRLERIHPFTQSQIKHTHIYIHTNKNQNNKNQNKATVGEIVWSTGHCGPETRQRRMPDKEMRVVK